MKDMTTTTEIKKDFFSVCDSVGWCIGFIVDGKAFAYKTRNGDVFSQVGEGSLDDCEASIRKFVSKKRTDDGREFGVELK